MSAAPPKRVLVIHSFGNAAPPFTTHSVAFEKELTTLMGKTVDLDEVSLDVARYATLDIEEALVELMRKRQTKWQPDLVVPIGSPAGIFVANHRDRLFPATTPIIYAGMDKRRLPAAALEQNATFVGESFDVPGWVEDILQIAPETNNIAVVIGASPLEQYWAEALHKEFQRYEHRVSFTWMNDLSLDEILQRTKTLPPRSFIFVALMMRDASGVTHNGDEVLQQIHAVANAPMNGIFQHQLGLGIVGGRLYQAEAEGVEAARVAIRILRGEPASNFPPMIIPALPPRYDWRELQKWGIDDKLLPQGSTVLFRVPTFWQQHRALVIGVVSVCAAQAVLIFALLVNLVRRRRAENEMHELRNELAHLARVTTLSELSGSLAHELNQPLAIILSNAEAAEQMLAGKSPDIEELKAIIQDIIGENHRAGEVIQSLRSMLKRGETHLRPLSLNEVAASVLRLMRRDLNDREVSVETDFAEALPDVPGDRVQLQQVIMNLILNACDAMEGNPPEERILRITTSLQGHGVRLSMYDEGCGLPGDDPGTIFKSFFTTKENGLGLGLSICWSIMAAHHGRIWGEPREGRGTVFHIELQAAESPDA